VWVLRRILESLRTYHIKGVFFITGHMAEKLESFPVIVDLLNRHEIGYHSSSHSVHPTIFEFTDVEDYKEAYETSLKRETSHINPCTGIVEGEGGIVALKKLFPGKEIRAFRAPGWCWTTPHVEAMRTLGVTFDFSADLSLARVSYKGITFYPYPVLGNWRGRVSEYRVLSLSLARRKLSVIDVHPSMLVNKDDWDAIYWSQNPKQIIPPQPRSPDEIGQLLHNFDLLLRQTAELRKLGLIKTDPVLEESSEELKFTQSDVEHYYQQSVEWAVRYYSYRPKYLHRHFLRFFSVDA
jgi:peptidoglycan/xylan/chitin deacetylase (PgdA/CDA1 family)